MGYSGSTVVGSTIQACWIRSVWVLVFENRSKQNLPNYEERNALQLIGTIIEWGFLAI